MKILLLLAGLMGAAGIVLTAAAAHGTSSVGLDSAGYLLVIHAAGVLAGVALIQQGSLSRTVGLIAISGLVLGAALFSGDIAMRAFVGQRLFPMAAPTGGTILILGWLAVALAALLPSRRAA